MAALGVPLMFLAYGLLVIGGIWFIIVTFSESIWWGLGSLLLPIISLIFLVVHWKEAKKPFLFNLFATALLVAGAILSEDIKT